MNSVMLLHHTQTYLDTKKKGSIWYKNYRGLWAQDYKDAPQKFLFRFDEAVQKQILRLARHLSSTVPLEPTVEEAIEDASR